MTNVFGTNKTFRSPLEKMSAPAVFDFRKLNQPRESYRNPKSVQHVTSRPHITNFTEKEPAVPETGNALIFQTDLLSRYPANPTENGYPLTFPKNINPPHRGQRPARLGPVFKQVKQSKHRDYMRSRSHTNRLPRRYSRAYYNPTVMKQVKSARRRLNGHIDRLRHMRWLCDTGRYVERRSAYEIANGFPPSWSQLYGVPFWTPETGFAKIPKIPPEYLHITF